MIYSSSISRKYIVPVVIRKDIAGTHLAARRFLDTQARNRTRLRGSCHPSIDKSLGNMESISKFKARAKDVCRLSYFRIIKSFVFHNILYVVK